VVVRISLDAGDRLWSAACHSLPKGGFEFHIPYIQIQHYFE
jgi:hypothetical protein